MFGKTWSMADGRIIKISDMTQGHLLNAADYIHKLIKIPQNRTIHLMEKLLGMLEEIKYRGLTPSFMIPSLEEFAEQLDMEYFLIYDPRTGNLESRAHLAKTRKVKKETPREEYEKIWQETEAKMLPEGDRDKIVMENVYVMVDHITRRMITRNDELLPSIGPSKNSVTKKCRVTIEVLED